MKHALPTSAGYTLVEILLGVSIMGALFILIITKVDIADVYAKLFSTGDSTIVRAIGESVTNYRWDNKGMVPGDSGITETLKPICRQHVSQSECDAAGGVYLGSLAPVYLSDIPVHKDYLGVNELMTGYQIQFPYGAGERVRVTSPSEGVEFVY